MRNPVLLAATVLGLAVVSQAQTTLNLGQPMTSANQGNPNGGIYFDMVVTNTITLDEIQYVASDASPAGTSAFNMYFGPSGWQGNVGANPGPWTLIGTTTPVAIPGAVDTIVDGVLMGAGPNAGQTVTFAPGTYGIALEAIGHSWGYQNGFFNFADANISVDTGGASNTFLALPTFIPRSINAVMTYTLGGTPIAVASQQTYGEGCYASYQTFYEQMGNTSTNQDLSNTSLYMTLNTSGANPVWDVTSGTAAPVLPGAAAVTQVFPDDNTSVVVPVTVPIQYPQAGAIAVTGATVEMSPDGFISLDGTNPGGNPVLADWLMGGARVGNHHDMDPITGAVGTVWVEEDFTTLQATIFTWEGIASRAQPGVNTIQIICYFTGDIEMRFGALNLAVGGGWPTIVGYSPGNGSLDPGTRDVSMTPYSTGGVDSNPLALASDANPVLGTTINLTTSDESTNPSIGATFFSLSPLQGTPVPLAVINAPGCFAHIGSLPVSVTIDNFSPPINGMSAAFPIPNNPVLIGATAGAQSVWLDAAANQIGLTSSNGVLLKFGI
tara:strand:+ start:41443 stop:43098 length:1656 start_codon:yes stop_codon:yes gene_type:complete